MAYLEAGFLFLSSFFLNVFTSFIITLYFLIAHPVDTTCVLHKKIVHVIATVVFIMYYIYILSHSFNT